MRRSPEVWGCAQGEPWHGAVSHATGGRTTERFRYAVVIRHADGSGKGPVVSPSEGSVDTSPTGVLGGLHATQDRPGQLVVPQLRPHGAEGRGDIEQTRRRLQVDPPHVVRPVRPEHADLG